MTIRRRLYPWVRRPPPFVMGYDVVGKVRSGPRRVSGLQFGDRVADMTIIGANADYCTLRANRVTNVPAGVDPAETAALILSWTTAFQLLHRAARVQRGQRALVMERQAPLLGKLGGLELWGRGAPRAFGADPGPWSEARRYPTRRSGTSCYASYRPCRGAPCGHEVRGGLVRALAADKIKAMSDDFTNSL